MANWLQILALCCKYIRNILEFTCNFYWYTNLICTLWAYSRQILNLELSPNTTIILQRPLNYCPEQVADLVVDITFINLVHTMHSHKLMKKERNLYNNRSRKLFILT